MVQLLLWVWILVQKIRKKHFELIFVNIKTPQQLDTVFSAGACLGCTASRAGGVAAAISGCHAEARSAQTDHGADYSAADSGDGIGVDAGRDARPAATG